MKCAGIVGWIFGHDFRSRFTTHKVTAFRPSEFSFVTGNFDPHVDDRTYQGDVCTRCGAVVNESPEQRRAKLGLVE